MRIAVCLLLSIAVGCATYTAGAIIWASADPQGAGKALLFTIPVSFGATAVLGAVALLGLVFRCDWSAPRAATRKRLTRPRRKAAAAAAAARPLEMQEDDDLILAT